jgi:hypothetical protein
VTALLRRACSAPIPLRFVDGRNFYFNIGEILILFNNDTGKIEWIDCGYGYFDIYEENPNGILANSIQEFLEKF